jgi:TfoX/Sxy family transcriptional regulator of competence genes
MSQQTITPDERYAALVEEFLGESDVEQSGKGFGSDALKVRGKIFAMLSHGRLVVKLPRQRVEALVASGDGERFDPRHDGRVMKEWLALAPTSQVEWLSLAREARAFVTTTR